MSSPLIAPPPRGRTSSPWAAALLTAAALSIAGCGGDDDIHAVAPPPAPAPAPTGAASQAVPTTANIVAAQASVDGTAPTVALPASGALTTAQIVAQQSALDGVTTSGLGNIASNQAAMDANGVQPTKLTP